MARRRYPEQRPNLTIDSLEILMILTALDLDIDPEMVKQIWTYRNESGKVIHKQIPNSFKVKDYVGPYIGIDFIDGFVPTDSTNHALYLYYIHFTTSSNYYRMFYEYPECLR